MPFSSRTYGPDDLVVLTQALDDIVRLRRLPEGSSERTFIARRLMDAYDADDRTMFDVTIAELKAKAA